MYKKLMVAVLAFMVIGVGQDCYAANKMNKRGDGSSAKRARERLKSALAFSKEAAALRAVDEKRREDVLAVTVVRAMEAAAAVAARNAKEQRKDSLIASMRKRIDNAGI